MKYCMHFHSDNISIPGLLNIPETFYVWLKHKDFMKLLQCFKATLRHRRSKEMFGNYFEVYEPDRPMNTECLEILNRYKKDGYSLLSLNKKPIKTYGRDINGNLVRVNNKPVKPTDNLYKECLKALRMEKMEQKLGRI